MLMVDFLSLLLLLLVLPVLLSPEILGHCGSSLRHELQLFA